MWANEDQVLSDAIEAVGAGRPSGLSTLVDLILVGSAKAVAASIPAIWNAVHNWDAVRLDRLDREFRGGWWAKPEDISDDELRRRTGGYLEVLGLASFHRSGYVRESAIRLLAQKQVGDELPFLLIRLNDWVSAVRELAVSAVRERLRGDYLRYFADCLPLLDSIARQNRAANLPLLREIEVSLSTPSALPILVESLSSPVALVRRSALVRIIRQPGEKVSEAIELATRSFDPMVRAKAFEAVFKGSEGLSSNRWIAFAMKDRFAAIRQRTLRHIAELDTMQPREIVLSAATDANAGVRQLARFLYNKWEQFSFCEHYRRLLAQCPPDSHLSGVVAGLGETGGVQDCQILLNAATNGSNKVRSSALRAIATLNPEGYVTEFVQALQDPYPSVVREARRFFAARPWLIDAGSLAQIASSSTEHASLSAAFRLLSVKRWWEAAPYLVELANSRDPVVATRALETLDCSVANPNRLSGRPTSQEIDRLAQAAANSRLGALTPRIAEDIRYHIDSARSGKQ